MTVSVRVIDGVGYVAFRDAVRGAMTGTGFLMVDSQQRVGGGDVNNGGGVRRRG